MTEIEFNVSNEASNEASNSEPKQSCKICGWSSNKDDFVPVLIGKGKREFICVDCFQEIGEQFATDNDLVENVSMKELFE